MMNLLRTKGATCMPNTAEPAETVKLGEPYCGQCGYGLTGLEESTRCPECGRPLLEGSSDHGSSKKMTSL